MNISTRAKVSIFSFLLALFFSYSPIWVPYYVNFFQKEKFTIFDDLNQYRMSCREISLSDAYCSDQYVLPKAMFKEGVDDPSVGFGHLLVYVRVGCFDNEKFIQISPSNQGASIRQNHQALNSYFIASFSLFKECKSGIAVQTWVAKNDVRHGYYSGKLIYGNAMAIEKVKRLVEYILVSIPQNIAMVGVILFFILSNYFGGLFYSTSRKSFFPLIPFWFLTFLFTSGLLLIFVPLDGRARTFSRIGIYFSMFTHLLVGARFFDQYKPYARSTKILNFLTTSFFEVKKRHLINSIFTPISFIFIIIVVQPFYSLGFACTSLIIALYIAFFGPRVLDLSLFTICYLIGIGKVFNVPNFPMSNITFYFVAFFFSYEIYFLIKNEMNNALYSVIEKSTNDSNFANQIVHDIRSPMMVLRLLLGQVSWSGDKEEMKSAVLSSLEKISSISKEALKKNKKLILVLASVGELYKSIQESEVLNKNINWVVKIPDELKSVKLDISKDTFSRVCQNLLNNAIEARKVMEVKITVSVFDEDFVEFTIENDGDSIPTEALQSILAIGGSYMKQNGTGLGVQFCKREIESIGGKFSLVSANAKTIVVFSIKKF